MIVLSMGEIDCTHLGLVSFTPPKSSQETEKAQLARKDSQRQMPFVLIPGREGADGG